MFEAYHRELMGFLTRRLRDPELAAELAQESYVRALSAGGGAQRPANPRAWLFRIARNLLIDHQRADRHRRHECLDTLPEALHPSLPEYRQPEAILAYEEQAQALVRAIDALPPRCREAFVLSRFEGLPHEEVARRMGISKGMVVQHLARALARCEACLREPAPAAGPAFAPRA